MSPKGHSVRAPVKQDYPRTKEILEHVGPLPSVPKQGKVLNEKDLHDNLTSFRELNKTTTVIKFPGPELDIPMYINEFWTSRQRMGHSLHEISYRACFKPQLPRFFIERLTRFGDVVYDPFMGRGTTPIEAALMGRKPFGSDINPLGKILVNPRLHPPDLSEIDGRLSQIDLESETIIQGDLSAFYHNQTLKRITNLRNYLALRREKGEFDYLDDWIRMVATNRLTGHSPGFFSVYTLPPNQAISIKSQLKINRDHGQIPPDRDVKEIILRKSRSMLRKLDDVQRLQLYNSKKDAFFITGTSEHTPEIRNESVNLVVTSPPFLDVVSYQKDNWLRCWFNDIDPTTVPIWQIRKSEEWQLKMTKVFHELRRVLVPGGFIAFEVGEVRRGKLLLETLVVPAAINANLEPLLIIINDQRFTKTANCWGVSNLKKGTNTNRIILIQKSIR